jgi:coenzyme F420-reducing hydrogenase delta subunit
MRINWKKLINLDFLQNNDDINKVLKMMEDIITYLGIESDEIIRTSNTLAEAKEEYLSIFERINKQLKNLYKS